MLIMIIIKIIILYNISYKSDTLVISPQRVYRLVIYTTKGAASLKSVLKIGHIYIRTVSIRHQSSRTFFYVYILPARDLWTARFLRLSFVFYDKNHNKCRHILRYFAMAQPPPTKKTTHISTAHDIARLLTT